MAFASDTFAGTLNTELSVYSAVWSKQTGYTQDMHVGVDGQYACNYSNAATAIYQHSGTPASADYSVFADIAKLSGAESPRMGVCGRMQAGASTYYLLLYLHDALQLRLYKEVAGALTQLGSSYSMTLTSTPVNIELRMAGDQISGYTDGVLRIGPVTDTAITTAGKAGIRGIGMRQAGNADAGSLDNFSAVDASTSIKAPLVGGTLVGGVLVGGALVR